MKYSLFKVLIFLSLILSCNSCLRFDMEHIMLTQGIPQSVNCSFVDKHGLDLVKYLVKNDSELLVDKNTFGGTVNTDYYSLKLKINGADIPIEQLKISDNTGSTIINPLTNKETEYTIYFGWNNLFTEELLQSKKWTDFNIEYSIVFPTLFKDEKEHILQCKIRKGQNGMPTLSDFYFDGESIMFSNAANFCFVSLN